MLELRCPTLWVLVMLDPMMNPELPPALTLRLTLQSAVHTSQELTIGLSTGLLFQTWSWNFAPTSCKRSWHKFHRTYQPQPTAKTHAATDQLPGQLSSLPTPCNVDPWRPLVCCVLLLWGISKGSSPLFYGAQHPK